ncbi:helix-turn-helix domain-containing protein [Roseobacter sp. GAI101]|uniref:helix-turn-helix domain-containing protein n=1 Tax=Roseobacter sp. (strain GAI101) TaxID=391589 RepID=UPI0018DC3931|nr:XRE family transcriptional regulator [Roseobacter sp. GAI101]
MHRLAARLSQSALAEASGISRRMIVAVETGDANISLSSLDKLAAALGLTFTDLIRDPSQPSRNEVNEVMWRGAHPESQSMLLASARASSEVQLWLWALAPGEVYPAEPDQSGWHEMIYVIEGTLTLTLSGQSQDYPVGSFAAYRSDQPYSYANQGQVRLKFVRNVVS